MDGFRRKTRLTFELASCWFRQLTMPSALKEEPLRFGHEEMVQLFGQEPDGDCP